jgi:nucleotide-binding universal stress UspA family protein
MITRRISMSTIEITTPTAPVNTGPAASGGRPRGVAVVYEARAEGRAALLYARALAADTGAPLTVLTVASRERTDMGCGSCRQGAAFRNEMACEFATADLTEARDVIAPAQADLAVDYVLARGSFTRAVLTTAGNHGADVIVLPGQRRGRVRRRVSRDRAKVLESRTSASVVVAPDAPDC